MKDGSFSVKRNKLFLSCMRWNMFLLCSVKHAITVLDVIFKNVEKIEIFCYIKTKHWTTTHLRRLESVARNMVFRMYENSLFQVKNYVHSNLWNRVAHRSTVIKKITEYFTPVFRFKRSFEIPASALKVKAINLVRKACRSITLKFCGHFRMHV